MSAQGAHIGSGVELGNYAEVKNSVIGAGSKSHHFSYLGDAEVGEQVNIGAGTITANYDGQRKHRTTIGDRAFIGSDTILRAPVSVGADALTGAGSVVTRDVPDGMMALGVPARIRAARARGQTAPSALRRSPRSRLMGGSLLEVLVIAVLVRPQRRLRGCRDRARHGPAQPHPPAQSTRATGAPDRVARMVEHPGRLLATIQLGITFIGFLAAAFAGASIAGTLAEWMRGIPILAASADLLALLVVTLVVSLVTIVFGELVPKTLALAHAERYALALARPMELLGRLLAPVVWLLTTITHGVTRLLGVSGVSDDAITTEELRILVERGGEQGTIEAEEEQMIGGVLELGERRVHEVMVARVDIVALSVDADAGRDRRDHRLGGPLAHPGLRGQHRQHRRHPLRQGPAALPRGRRPAAAHPQPPAHAPLRARVDARGRPAAQPAAAARPHRHRARRARRHGRPRLDRGPHRGDRGRDPGRVRRGGADDRAPRR